MVTEEGVIENPLLEYDEAYILGVNSEATLDIYRWEIWYKEEMRKRALQENGGLPLAVSEAYVAVGDEDEKLAYVTVKNLSENTITDFSLSLNCLDWAGNGVKYNGTGRTTYSALVRGTILGSGQEKTYFWKLTGYEAVARVSDIRVLNAVSQ